LGRSRGSGAFGRVRLRKLCEAEQEDLRRSRRRGSGDHLFRQAERSGRAASRRQDRRSPGHPGDVVRHAAPGEGAGPDGERDLGAAGREAHPLARQAPDGEDPARILSERADEGDPEGARRRRKAQKEKTQGKFYLKEQRKATQKELGDDEGRDELADLEEKIAKTKLSKE